VSGGEPPPTAGDSLAPLSRLVRADPVRPEELAGECAECQVILRSFKTIYTRAPQRRG
jgi:hypothetical protein